jgi:hypothetical protein
MLVLPGGIHILFHFNSVLYTKRDILFSGVPRGRVSGVQPPPPTPRKKNPGYDTARPTLKSDVFRSSGAVRRSVF